MSIEAMRLALEALENHTAIQHPQQRHYRDSAIEALRAAIKQAEKQEPVAHCSYPKCQSTAGCVEACNRPLYTAPRQWQGLTDEEIINVLHPLVMADLSDEATDYEIARAIETKLKEKNT